MPIPTPRPEEKQQEFVSRCISAIYDEYGKEKSSAICFNTYREHKKKTIVKSLIDNTIELIKLGGK